MTTVEIERSHDAPVVVPPSTRPAHPLLRPARILGTIAAFLAFGLLGAVAALWHLTRGRAPADHTCSGCRVRARLIRGGTFALAGLVLLGSGMAVHQQTSEPDLPSCGAGSPELAADWLQAREVVTAPVSALVRGYVHDRGGGLCEAGPMTLALLPAPAPEPGLAVGSIVLAGDESPIGQEDGEAMARHESRHVTQWAASTLAAGPLAMPLTYVVDDTFFPESRNHFERGADLSDGGYPQPDDAGPRPAWGSVAVLGLLLSMVLRRRLRWGSRVLAGGAAGAVARQRGLCPLHSSGWFRLARA